MKIKIRSVVKSVNPKSITFFRAFSRFGDSDESLSMRENVEATKIPPEGKVNIASTDVDDDDDVGVGVGGVVGDVFLSTTLSRLSQKELVFAVLD